MGSHGTPGGDSEDTWGRSEKFRALYDPPEQKALELLKDMASPATRFAQIALGGALMGWTRLSVIMRLHISFGK